VVRRFSGERLAPAGERLAGTDEQLASTGERLAGMDERLAPTGERLAGTDERLAQAGERLARRAPTIYGPLKWIYNLPSTTLHP
jgi:hypothetical protein